jgi:hypothetical protein
MERLVRLAKLAALGLGFAVYVWFAAVHLAGEAKRNREARRAARERVRSARR